MTTSIGVDLPGLRTPAVGMDTPFEMLVACHERVQRSLDLLQRLQRHLVDHGRDHDAAQAARDVMRYFDLAAPLHHEDEELHVFPALLHAPDTGVHAVVHRLMQDHCDMQVNWAAAREVLAEIVQPTNHGGDVLAQEQTATLLRFSSLYARHIHDEEHMVYPAAKALLLPAQVHAMSQDMMQRRGAA